MASPRPKRKQNLTPYYLLGGCFAVLAIAILVVALHKRPPPPAPPPPAPPPAPVQTVMRYTEPFYKALLDEDTKKYGVPAVTVDEMALPLGHSVDLAEPRELKPGATLETPHLKIAARVQKMWAVQGAAQRYRFDHLVLSITNSGSAPIAYRVDTTVERGENNCRGKGEIAHNAIALRPGETIERTECMIGRATRLHVNHVEVIELTTLGYHYVSRLDPAQLGLDARTAQSHTSSSGKPCAAGLKWREVEMAGGSWLDVIDFYARHSCDEYLFFPTYRFRTSAAALPAREATAAPTAPAPPPAAEASAQQ